MPWGKGLRFIGSGLRFRAKVLGLGFHSKGYGTPVEIIISTKY